jgi:hypothetical protein
MEPACRHHRSRIECVYLIILYRRNPSNTALSDYYNRQTFIPADWSHQQLIVPLEEIKSFDPYEGPETITKEESKQVFDAVLADFFKEKPQFEVEFHHPTEARFMYGFKKKVTKAYLRLDDPQKFYNTLSAKINKIAAN